MAIVPDQPLITVACHCPDCQRRTGMPFGVMAYYRAMQVDITGETISYRRMSAGGNAVAGYFYPHCASTVFLRLEKQPEIRGVAVGAIGDPAFPAPDWSLWEQSRHDWISLPDHVRRFAQGD